MPKEKEAIGETPEVVETIEEPTQEELKAQVESLSSERDSIKTQLEQAQEEILTKDRTVSKKDRDLKKTEKLESRLDKLEKRLEKQVVPMLSDLIDRGDDVEYQPKSRKSDEYKLPDEPQAKAELEPPEEWEDAMKVVKSVGLDMMESDELAKAYRLFVKGDFAKGLQEAQSVVDGIRKDKETIKDKKSEWTDDDLEEAARQWNEKKGVSVSDKGAPSAGTMTTEKATKMYSEGDMSEEEAIKQGVKFT